MGRVRLRLIAGTVSAIVLAAGLVGWLAVGPSIQEDRRMARAQERTADANARRLARRDRIAEQRARVSQVGARAGRSQVEERVTVDAQERVARGTERRFPSRSECEALPGSAVPGVTSYDCIAVTEESDGGTIGNRDGYPYRAVLDRGNRQLTLCKVSQVGGRAPLQVPLPPACQG